MHNLVRDFMPHEIRGGLRLKQHGERGSYIRLSGFKIAEGQEGRLKHGRN